NMSLTATVNMSLTDINASLTEHNLHQQCKLFSRGGDLIACLNKAMAFLTVVVSSRNAAWYKEKAMLVKAQEAGQILDEEQLAFLADLGIPASQVQTIIPHNSAFQNEDLDTYDSDCDDLSNVQAVLMVNISNYGSDVIAKVPNSDNYLNDMDNQKESRSKLYDISHKPIDYENLNRLTKDFEKRFTPQQELSAKQAFWLRISNLTIESSLPPVKLEVPIELPKRSESCEMCLNLDADFSKSKQEYNDLLNNETKVAITPMNKIKKVTFAEPIETSSTDQETHDSNKPMLHSTGVKCSTSASGSKPSESKNTNHSEPNHTWGSIATDIPSSSSLVMTGCPDCTMIARIMGYGDYQLGNVVISRTKDEALAAIIKCIENIRVRLNATVWNVQTDNGIEFVNQTLREFYENVGISHQTFVAHTPKQNVVVERFLKTKDEALAAIIKCIENIQVRLNATVWNVQTDNGIEFVNQTLREFYENVSISHQTFVAHTPKQNVVVESLLYPKLFFDLSSIQQNFIRAYATQETRLIIRSRLWITVLSYQCHEDLGKFDAKVDIGIFVGYAPAKKAFRIYNRRTQIISETIHVTFNELTTMASKQFSLGVGLHVMTPATPKVAAPTAEVSANSSVSISISQDAPSISIPSSQVQEHCPIISQGFEESPKIQMFLDDPLNESLQDSPSQGSSSNVIQIHTPYKHIGR
nr:hypothetical protein [Tanacetum cinerariifolium]